MNYLNQTKYFGTQIFYSKINENNITIANVIQKKANQYFKFDKEIKPIKDKYMFDKIKLQGVLIEYGFMSNSNDRYKLKKE